jgi:hypothetical protein
MTSFKPDSFQPIIEFEQIPSSIQNINLREVREKQTQSWDKRLETAYSNYVDFIPTLESFTQIEWDEFIACICRDSLPFNICEEPGGSPLFVSLGPSLEDVTQESKTKIGKSIEKILKQALKVGLNKSKTEECNCAYLIATYTPIEIQDKELLRKIITEPNQTVENITFASRLLVDWTEITNDIQWWENIIKSNGGKNVLPMTFDKISKSSSQLAIQFLNKFSDRIDVDIMKITISRFVGVILEKGEGKDFTLKSFPESLHEYIKRLLTLDKFKSLREAWGIEETK